MVWQPCHPDSLNHDNTGSNLAAIWRSSDGVLNSIFQKKNIQNGQRHQKVVIVTAEWIRVMYQNHVEKRLDLEKWGGSKTVYLSSLPSLKFDLGRIIMIPLPQFCRLVLQHSQYKCLVLKSKQMSLKMFLLGLPVIIIYTLAYRTFQSLATFLFSIFTTKSLNLTLLFGRKWSTLTWFSYFTPSIKDRCYTWSAKTAVFYILFDIFLTRPSFKNPSGVFLT